MGFTTKTWENFPATTTPINAAALENLESRLAAYAEEVGETAALNTLQAGVISSSDWTFKATINGSTGALSSEAATGGIAWLPSSSVLVRTSTTSAVISGLAPATKPAAGKFMIIGFELTAGEWDNSATVSLKSGTEMGSEGEALLFDNTPATTAGKIRVLDVAVKNTAGTYSIIAQRDRRPWAQGASYTVATTERSLSGSGGESGPGAEEVISTFRLELSSGLAIVESAIPFTFTEKSSTQWANVLLEITPSAPTAFIKGVTKAELTAAKEGATPRYKNVVGGVGRVTTTGSTLFKTRLAITDSNSNAESAFTASPGLITVREIIGPSANNGTS